MVLHLSYPFRHVYGTGHPFLLNTQRHTGPDIVRSTIARLPDQLLEYYTLQIIPKSTINVELIKDDLLI
jgi:hypothetical protein